MHLAMPGATFDAKHGLWRSLRKTGKGGHYLFNHKALAAVFRGKLLAALNAQGLTAPVCLDAATKTANIRPCALPGRLGRANFREMFSVPLTGL